MKHEYDELVYDLDELLTHDQKMLELHLQVVYEDKCKVNKWKKEEKTEAN